MRTNRVYVEQRLASGGFVEPGDATAHYLTRVLRLRPGAALVVFDGRGGEFEAQLAFTARDKVRIEVGRHVDREVESPLRLTLAQGIARGERMDYVLQKATELGVTAIVPMLTERVVVRLDAERARRRLAHWRKVVVHACQQCGRNRLPELAEPVSLHDWLAAPSALPETRLLLQPDAKHTLQSVAMESGHSVAVLIGPEGGLTESERDTATQHGFTPVSIGPRILRTETAALASLAILQSRHGDAS